MTIETNLTSHLRPIGTVFEEVYPPSDTWSMNGMRGLMSTDGWMFTVIKHQVVDHVLLDNGVVAKLEPLAVRKVPAKGWERYRGMITAIPPDELLDLLPADWHCPILSMCYDNSDYPPTPMRQTVEGDSEYEIGTELTVITRAGGNTELLVSSGGQPPSATSLTPEQVHVLVKLLMSRRRPVKQSNPIG